MKPIQYCQSCLMPLAPQIQGTEADGSKSEHYCIYCYEKGAFTQDITMEEMIAQRAPLFANSNPDMTYAEASDLMHELFPRLMRWNTVG